MSRNKKIYLLHIWGDVEPDLKGPFASEEQRDMEALCIRADSNYPDGLYPVTVTDSYVSVGTYAGGFFDGC
jgi:hypothetical protein